MQFEVRLFSSIKEKLNRSKVTVTLETTSEITVSSILEAIRLEHPGLETLLPYCRVAVNHVYQNGDWVLRGGEEIAIIPPVSGG